MILNLITNVVELRKNENSQLFFKSENLIEDNHREIHEEIDEEKHNTNDED